MTSEKLSRNGDSQDAATAAETFPKPAFFIVGNEACERFSYYGMRGILTVYTSSVLYSALSQNEANRRAIIIGHIFTMGVYFMPLLGAWIADKFWGRFWTILVMSIVYCAGNATLAATVGSELGLVVGLSLITIGSGGIKPCVSAFMGDQFSERQKHLLPKAFGMFYWAINFGSFFSFLIVPLLKTDGDVESYRWAFGVPGIAMGVATLIFALGAKLYKNVPPERVARKAIAEEKSASACAAPMSFREKFHAIKGILMIFAIGTVFWALFDQMSTTWVTLSEKMVPWTPISALGYVIDKETVQAVNPIFVMLLVPIFTFALYPMLNKTRLFRATPLRRMAVGMVLAAGAFAICGALQARVSAGAEVSILWMCLPYAVLTAGEVLFSATGLEFAFSQAPATMKSTITSFWNLSVVIGNALVVAVAWFGSAFTPAQQFFFFAILMLTVAVVFGFAATRYKYRNDATEA